MRAEVGVPVAADESIAGADDVRRAAELGACDAVNVKLAGERRLRARARRPARPRARPAWQAWLSSTLDGPWGIAAALQLAAGEDLSLACGLATLELFDAEIARALPGPAQRADGRAPGPRPGRRGRQTTRWPRCWSRKSR